MDYFDQQTMPTILCCVCGVTLKSFSASAMCVNCLKGEHDITEGIPKQVSIQFCKKCERYFQPPNAWLVCELESRQLLSLCLKKLKGLSKVRLIDAGFIWTEPHSRRLKVKLTIQKEVENQTIMQQSFVVEYMMLSMQCPDCHKMEANQTWKAVAQIRQKVKHKRTFFYLEQLILKHNAHSQCVGIKELPDGLDFYFMNRSHASKFVEFVGCVTPIEYKTAKELVSHDEHTSSYNYRYTFSVEIIPICKDDLICLPKKLANKLGSISPLCVVSRVTNVVQIVDPFSLQTEDISTQSFWRTPFRSIADRRQLTTFIVIDVEKTGQYFGKYALADVIVARESDFGYNDEQIITRSHLGNLLKSGDTCSGFDLVNLNCNDDDIKSIKVMNFPDVILVKKTYPVRRSKYRDRFWKLKYMNKTDEVFRKQDIEKRETDHEIFLRDIEEDKELRSLINLYKNIDINDKFVPPQSDDEEEDFPEVQVNELLEDMEALQLNEEDDISMDSNNNNDNEEEL